MKRAWVSVLLAVGCSGRRTVAPVALAVASQGPAYALSFEPDSLLFCDQRGMLRLDLGSGQVTAAHQACPRDQANPACRGLGLEITVRSPQSQPDDLVDVGGASFPVKGRVHDCAANDPLLAIATGSAVELIDIAKKSTTEIAGEGAGRVAVGAGWIAWTTGSSVRARVLGGL